MLTNAWVGERGGCPPQHCNQDRRAKDHDTGRFTTPEEVATLVALLASERTANVTGANYIIDGGLIKTT